MLLLDLDRPELGRVTFSAFVARVFKNVPYVIKAAGESITASDFYWRQGLSKLQAYLPGVRGTPGGLSIIPIIGFAFLAAAGLLLFVRDGRSLIALYAFGSIILMCTIPWRSQFERYMAPVAPFLIVAAVFAADALFIAVRSRSKSQGGLLTSNVVLDSVLAVVLAVQVFAISRLFFERAHHGISYAPAGGANGVHFFYHDRLWRGWEHAMDWIRKNAPPGAIIATPASHFCYLQTGRRAVSPPKESDAVRARHLLASVPVSYVVDRGYSLAAIETDPEEWHLVGDFDGIKLYARNTESSG
jgi:hypothetical protein